MVTGQERPGAGEGLLTQEALWHVPFQACHVEGGSAGLIPSQLLEEKRKAFVKRDLELTPTSGRRSEIARFTSLPSLRPGMTQLACLFPRGQGHSAAASLERKKSE